MKFNLPQNSAKATLLKLPFPRLRSFSISLALETKFSASPYFDKFLMNGGRSFCTIMHDFILQFKSYTILMNWFSCFFFITDGMFDLEMENIILQIVLYITCSYFNHPMSYIIYMYWNQRPHLTVQKF